MPIKDIPTKDKMASNYAYSGFEEPSLRKERKKQARDMKQKDDPVYH